MEGSGASLQRRIPTRGPLLRSGAYLPGLQRARRLRGARERAGCPRVQAPRAPGPRIAAAVQMPGKQPDALPELAAATPQRRGGEDQASSCAYTVGILRPGPIGDKEEGNPPRKKLQNAPECLHIKLT